MSSEKAWTIIDTALQKTLGGKIEVDAETDLVGDGVMDSLDFLRFIFHVEKNLGRKIPVTDVADANLSNVGVLVNFLQE